MRTTISGFAFVAAALLTAGCGDDSEPADDPSPDAPTSAASDPATDDDGETGGTDASASEPESDATTENPGNTAKVQDTADKLDCTAGAAIDGFEGETEYECGPYLIVDWSTAGISEQEMFTAIDQWVDEERPVWLYAGDMVLVYGTQANLEPISSEFE